MKTWAATLAVAGMLLAGCGSGEAPDDADDEAVEEIEAENEPEPEPEPEEQPEPEPEPGPAEQPEPEPEADDPCPLVADGRTVNADCVDPWPLSVDEVFVRCEIDGDVEVPLIDTPEATYALTGHGSTHDWGKELAGEIWADDDSTGAKVNISSLRDTALDHC